MLAGLQAANRILPHPAFPVLKISRLHIHAFRVPTRAISEDKKIHDSPFECERLSLYYGTRVARQFAPGQEQNHEVDQQGENSVYDRALAADVGQAGHGL
jgi:hypothetical protein